MSDPESVEKPAISQAQFLEWRSPRIGHANPTVMSNPLWEWLIRTRMNAYQANRMWSGPSSCGAGPMWCFERFGQSTTALPDGRAVFIAGEHEDHYDPDFCIYNDIVVTQPDGAISIHGYPREVFPPTDFHTATLAAGRIVLIGSLGHVVDRIVGTTQVLELALDTLMIRKIETQGESPGWISRHNATLSDAGDAVVVSGGKVYGGPDKILWENVDAWELNLSTWTWTRKTHRDWQQWAFMRTDRTPNQLWHIRHALWMRDVGSKDDLAKEMQRLASLTGFEPDLNVVRSLYCPDASAVELPRTEDEYNIVRVSLDGVTVRFTEDSFSVEVLVEGALAEPTKKELQRSVLEKLSRLDGAEWMVLAKA